MPKRCDCHQILGTYILCRAFGLGYDRPVHYRRRCVKGTVSLGHGATSGQVVAKSTRSRARRFCLANHDANDAYGPVHVVSSQALDLTRFDLAQLACQGRNGPSEWTPQALQKILLNAI